MIKLNDTQAILLSTASQRSDGSLYPLPEQLAPGARVTKAVAALVSRRLAEERETSDPATVSRSDGDLRYGVFATPAGLQAIGIDVEGAADGGGSASARAELPAPPQRQTKSAAVVALLSRPEGATLAELIAATDWLPHTTRAALTGLKKKGHRITRSKCDGVTCYTIVEQAA